MVAMMEPVEGAEGLWPECGTAENIICRVSVLNMLHWKTD